MAKKTANKTPDIIGEEIDSFSLDADVIQAGEIYTAIIDDIRKGTTGEFFNEKVEGDPDCEALEIRFSVPGMDNLYGREIITIPGKQVKANSKYAKLKSLLQGRKLERNMEIKTRVNAKGFLEIAFP